MLPTDHTAKIAIVQGDPAYAPVKLDTDGFITGHALVADGAQTVGI